MAGPSTVSSNPALARPEASYIDWPAAIAGAVLATAIAFVLITFGSGLGLSMISPEPGEGLSAFWFTIAAGLWFVWVSVSSFGAGGYLAGRMRRRIGDSTGDESETRDGAHGLLVWATGALLGAMLATSGVTGLVSTAAKTVGGAADPIASALEGNMDYYASSILRTDAAQNAGELAQDPAIRDRVVTIMSHGLRTGELSPEDRADLGSIVARATGKDEAAATAQVDAVLAQIDTAKQTAIDAANTARVTGVITAFVVAATLLISAAVAASAAILGGKHRDENLSFRVFGR